MLTVYIDYKVLFNGQTGVMLRVHNILYTLLYTVFVESEKSQLENVHVSSYRQHPQLKLINKFGNLNSVKFGLLEAMENTETSINRFLEF